MAPRRAAISLNMNTTRHALIALLAALASTAQAQPDRTLRSGAPAMAIPGTAAVTFAPPATLQPRPLAPAYSRAIQPQATAAASPTATVPTATAADTAATRLAAPEATLQATHLRPTLPYGLTPYGSLHRGLNVSLGMSVFAQFGKHARRGAGFTQSLSATYLQPLGQRMWMAVGGYVDHTIWGGDSYTTGGLYGEMGYRFDDHWAAYIYGRKSIVNSGIQAYGYPYAHGLYGYSPYLYDTLGDKLGAALRWTPNPSLSIELSVEKNWYPSSQHGYTDKLKYNYPLPKD